MTRYWKKKEVTRMVSNQLQELRTLYAKVRAGHDPDTKQLHISEEEFVTTLLSLITEAETKARIGELQKLLKTADAEFSRSLSPYLKRPVNDRIAALKETHEK